MNPNGYPFLTRRQILEKIQADPEFVADCMGILQQRHEVRGVGTTSMGWMASHASKATALAAKVAAGEASDEALVEAAKLVARYSKQLARVFRERELAARPELSAQAAVFGIGGGAAQPAPAAAGTSVQQPAPPKRRGRPKGSKNKSKESPAPRRRRRT
jgi:hypothetical protein